MINIIIQELTMKYTTMTGAFEVQCLRLGDAYDDTWEILTQINRVIKDAKISLYSAPVWELQSLQFEFNENVYELFRDEYFLYCDAFHGIYLPSEEESRILEQELEKNKANQYNRYFDLPYEYSILQFQKNNQEEVLKFLNQGHFTNFGFQEANITESKLHEITFHANNKDYTLLENEYVGFCKKFNGFQINP